MKFLIITICTFLPSQVFAQTSDFGNNLYLNQGEDCMATNLPPSKLLHPATTPIWGGFHLNPEVGEDNLTVIADLPDEQKRYYFVRRTENVTQKSCSEAQAIILVDGKPVYANSDDAPNNTPLNFPPFSWVKVYGSKIEIKHALGNNINGTAGLFGFPFVLENNVFTSLTSKNKALPFSIRGPNPAVKDVRYRTLIAELTEPKIARICALGAGSGVYSKLGLPAMQIYVASSPSEKDIPVKDSEGKLEKLNVGSCIDVFGSRFSASLRLIEGSSDPAILNGEIYY